MSRNEFNLVGKPRRRVDGRAKVTGQTVFADDMTLPRMAWCKLLRSPHPHAEIVAIDSSAALAHPGVLTVLTGADTPNFYGILPVSQDETGLSTGRVRYVGDPVAAVIATDERTAAEAVRMIQVEYKTLETIASPEQALNTPEPRLHDYGEEGNIHKRAHFRFGDIDEALESADLVVEGTYHYEGNTHAAMEQHASLAAVDKNGKVTLWSSTQCPHYVHRALQKALEIPADEIRVIATPNGGGFGGKSDIINHEIIVTVAALKVGRPVKICLTREEVFYAHRGRHPVKMNIRTGVNNDGKLQGMDLETLVDGGGYGSYGVASLFYTGALAPVTYHLPRYRFRGARTFTNKPPCGPKRGHGTPQPRFGQEVQLDVIAEKLKLDPAELRLKNLVQPNSLTTNFLRVGTIGLGDCIRKVTASSGWSEKFRKLPQGRGVGIACSSYLCGAGLAIYWNKMPQSGVQLQIDRSGRATVFCGATEIGQGSDDVLLGIVAEILGLDPLKMTAVTGDTELTPVDLGSYSSRVTLMMGNAAIQAAERAREMIASAVAKKLDIKADRLVFADERVFDHQDPEQGMSWKDAVWLGEEMHGTLGTVGSYTPPRPAAKFKGGGVGPSPAYSYSACVTEVEVDPETGWISVPKIWIAHDIGRALNPVLVRGQVIGSVYMGLGEALMEEQTFRRLPPKLSGALVHRAPSLLDYKLPTTHDMPEVHIDLIEDPDPNAPFGAKEVGQGPLLPVMPAVANAVYDAVGVRIDEVPITPDKILRALERKAKGEEPRFGPASFPAINWPEVMDVPPPWEGGDGRAANDPKRVSAARLEEEAVRNKGVNR
jgi:4-hydroxybenzoyl-CoA reductase subunit alpha